MEQEIIQLLIEKNFTGLEKLIDYLGTDVIRTIFAILNRPEEHSYRKEVENEIFYRIWKKIPTYDAKKSSLKTWVLTITRNLCLDKKRMLIRQRNLEPIESLSEFSENDNYFEKENFLDLTKSLSEEDQYIFLHHYYYQDSPQEIAALLDTDAAYIYNHLSRGRKKLKDYLSKEEF